MPPRRIFSKLANTRSMRLIEGQRTIYLYNSSFLFSPRHSSNLSYSRSLTFTKKTFRSFDLFSLLGPNFSFRLEKSSPTYHSTQLLHWKVGVAGVERSATLYASRTRARRNGSGYTRYPVISSKGMMPVSISNTESA